MARPKNLQTKSSFNVLQYGVTFALCYKNKVIKIGERSKLYRERMKYISWYDKFKRLNIISVD